MTHGFWRKKMKPAFQWISFGKGGIYYFSVISVLFFYLFKVYHGEQRM